MACLGAISGRSHEVLLFRFGLFKVTACATVHVSSQATRQNTAVDEHEGRGKQSGASFHHFHAPEGCLSLRRTFKSGL